MKTARDNLLLIAAFAVAVLLHAVALPWVGAAVGEQEVEPHFDMGITRFEADSFAKAGEDVIYRVEIELLSDPRLGGMDTYPHTNSLSLSRDRSFDDEDAVVNEQLAGTVPHPRFPTYPIDADGPYWLIYRLDANAQVPDSDRSNNTRVAPVYIDGPQRPELSVATFDTPERAVAGGSILVDFAIDNVGDGWASSNPQLGEHGWSDRIYLSTDERLDPTDLPLRTVERRAPLEPDGGYRHESIELDIPRGISGPMFLILAGDADQVLDQPSFIRGFATRPIEVVDTNRPDLIVAAIGAPDRLVIGRPGPVVSSIANLGSVATPSADWIDGVYLSREPELSPDAIPHRQFAADRPLLSRSRYETGLELTLPEDAGIESGRWYLVVRADADDAVDESVFEGNNALAVPVDVLTPEEADAQIKLGDPDRPERLVVQWIEHERVEEHIAQRSRTVQPALQSQVDPDPNAPLVDRPTPPAVALDDAAAGNPANPANPSDNTPNQNARPAPPLPDAAATDQAPRPQTQGSPNPQRIDGLPGDDGTLNPRRDGADAPNPLPPRPLDPTPSDADTPTPEPGDRDVPSPADPTAPDTDTTTDSDTPADTESDTDSNNPEDTDTTKPTEQQTTPNVDQPADNPDTDRPSETDGQGDADTTTTDRTTTPKPAEDDTAQPDGDEADPAAPTEEANPTRAPKDDSEAPPTNIKIVELELQEGRVLVGKGIKVTTKLPTPPGVGSRVLSIPRNARVSITFDNTGKVFEAKMLRSTNYKEWDAAIEASLYRWSARGEAIDNAKPHVTIEWNYLLNDLFDEDE